MNWWQWIIKISPTNEEKQGPKTALNTYKTKLLNGEVNKFETLTRWWVSMREIFEHLDRIKDLVEHLITECFTTVQLLS